MASWRLKHPSTRAGQWLLNGNALDVSGYGNDGAWVGAEGYGAGPLGSRQAAALVANTDYVNAGNPAGIQLTEAFTCCFWVRPTENNHSYLTKGSASRTGAAEYEWDFESTGAVFRFGVSDGAAQIRANASAIPAVNAWHHIAGTFNRVGTAGTNILYVNGIADGTATNADFTPQITHNLYLGGVGTWSMTGRIADVRVYNVALSHDEIIAIIHEAVPV